MLIGYNMAKPEINNWVDLNSFNNIFVERKANQGYREAIRNNLKCINVSDIKLKSEAYDIIVKNRALFGRKTKVSFAELMDRSKIFPVDFFLVKDRNEESLGSAVFYQGHPKIVQGIFWGDTLYGRQFRSMDILAMHCYQHYKKFGYEYIDLGISSEEGIPNEGLLRFKETHNAISSLRYTFSWSNGS
jgi:hypothetical protein